MTNDELKGFVEKIAEKVEKGFEDLNKRVTRLETILAVLGAVIAFLVALAGVIIPLYLTKGG